MPKTKNALNEEARKFALGRPKGARNRAPRVKRLLTPLQKLRQHVLVELDLDLSDVARAVGATRQTVSNLFLDEHRSEVEGQIIAVLQDAYRRASDETKARVDVLIGGCERCSMITDYGQDSITRESLGWAPKVEKEAPYFVTPKGERIEL